MSRKIVAVFGGRAPQAGSADYEQARALGQALAQTGYVVMTGGYGGTMEAASRGAKEAGGRVIGVTVGRFDESGLRPNAWLDEEVKFPDLFQRLHYLVTTSAAIVALRGGVGTLSEVALTWSLMQVGEMPRKPLVLVGPGWRKTLETFRNHSTANERDWKLLIFVSQVGQVVQMLDHPRRDERRWTEHLP
jgi:uncharacterized protein (TIGR00730 family)